MSVLFWYCFGSPLDIQYKTWALKQQKTTLNNFKTYRSTWKSFKTLSFFIFFTYCFNFSCRPIYFSTLILFSHSSNSLPPSNTKINAHSALELSITQQYSGIQAHSSLCLCPLPLLSSSVAYSTLPASFPVLPAWQAPCNRGVIGAAAAASAIEMSSPLLRFTDRLTKTMSESYFTSKSKRWNKKLCIVHQKTETCF